MVIRKNQSGVALLAVIFLMVVIAFIGVMFLSLSSTNMTQSVNEVYSSKALYIAEGGLERAGRYLLKREDGTQTTYTCASFNTSTSFNGSVPANTALGNGQFTVASYPYNITAPAILSAGGIDNSAATTTVPTTSGSLSAAGYAPFGQIMIDKEKINYTSLSANVFLGAIRGADGTIRAVHAGGAPVAQTQCELTSNGGVPNLNTGSAQRVVRQADILQTGWAVGKSGGTSNLRPLTINWNGSAWSVQDNSLLNTNNDLEAVNCTSPVDCWAVGEPGGAKPFIIHWDGSAWSLKNTGVSGYNIKLQSIYCVSSTDCWAVGKNGTLFRWDGLSWFTGDSGLPCCALNGLEFKSIYLIGPTRPTVGWREVVQ
ncbi:MAG: hypothetical protein HYR81_04480 [Nitrospirae bacterium]|nr:hypothetical protein [Nitrospirota bacterium]